MADASGRLCSSWWSIDSSIMSRKVSALESRSNEPSCAQVLLYGSMSSINTIFNSTATASSKLSVLQCASCQRRGHISTTVLEPWRRHNWRRRLCQGACSLLAEIFWAGITILASVYASQRHKHSLRYLWQNSYRQTGLWFYMRISNNDTPNELCAGQNCVLCMPF